MTNKRFLVCVFLLLSFSSDLWAEGLHRFRFFTSASATQTDMKDMVIDGDIESLLDNPNKTTDPNGTKGYQWKTSIGDPDLDTFSFHYIHSSGFGVGYTSLRTSFDYKFKLPSGTSSSADPFDAQSWEFSGVVQTSFIDLSYTLGDSLSWTVGGGMLVTGEGEITEKYKKDGYNAGEDGVSTTDGKTYGQELFDYEYEYSSKMVTGQAFFTSVGYALGPLELLVGYRQTTLLFGGFSYEQVLHYDDGTTVTYDDGTQQTVTRQHSASYQNTIQDLQMGLGMVF